jgi:hypothetical protein
MLAHLDVGQARGPHQLYGAGAGRSPGQHHQHGRVLRAQAFGHEREARSEALDLEVDVERVRREQAPLQGSSARIGVLAQALATGLGQLLGHAHEVDGDAEQLGTQAQATAPQRHEARVHLTLDLAALLDLIPSVAPLRLPLGVLVHGGAQGVLGAGLGAQQLGLVQGRQHAGVGLAAVLHAEQVPGGDALVLGRAPGEVGELHFHSPQAVQDVRVLQIAQQAVVGHAVEPRRAPRVAGDEDQVPLPAAVRAPIEPVLGPQRGAVLVDTEETHVEGVARILEVVRVAAEEGRLLLGGHHQTHVRVALVAVQVVAAALIERDHLAEQAGRLFGLALDLRAHAAPGRAGLGRVRARGARGHDAFGHVLDRPQDVQLEVGTGQLLGSVVGVEAGLEQVALGAAQLLEDVGADVVVGHHQPVARNERARAAGGETHGRLLHVLEPLGARLESVARLELLEWRVVEQPHTLVGRRQCGEKGQEGDRGTEQEGLHDGGS